MVYRFFGRIWTNAIHPKDFKGEKRLTKRFDMFNGRVEVQNSRENSVYEMGSCRDYFSPQFETCMVNINALATSRG